MQNYGQSTPYVLPLDIVAGYGALAIAGVLVMVGLGLLFLRSSTAVEELRTG